MFAKFSKKPIYFDILLAATLVALSLLLNQLQILQRWNNLFYDMESTVISRPVDNKIVIVAIDESSLRTLGRWPWSRAIHARLIDQLTTTGVAAIGMDILFMESDFQYPEDDQLLAAAIRRNGHVVLPVLTNIKNDHYTMTKPISMIAESANLAHVNMNFDSQGIVRQFDLQLPLDGNQSIPAMALALSRQLPAQTKLPDHNKLLINFSYPLGQFSQVSYADVLLDAEIRNSLIDKIVLVGITASGLGSQIATPVSKNQQLMSGIELQANALNTLLSGHIPQPVHWALYTTLSLLFIVIPVSLFRHFRLSISLLLVLASLTLSVIFSTYLLCTWSLWFTPLPTLLCLILSYPIWSLYKLEQLNSSLFKEHEQASATLKAIEDAVISTDNQGCIEFMNAAAETMLACTLTEAKQQPLSDFCKILDSDHSPLSTGYTLSPDVLDSEPKIVRNKEGDEYSVRISNSPIYTQNDQLAGVVYALSDLSEIININKKILFVATHDELTGLPNRVLLQDRLEQAIITCTREKNIFAILFIDLDGFKKINDAMGHASGDLLLKEVSNRLRNWVRLSDTIARWGGDEFIVLLDNLTHLTDATEVAVKIQQSLTTPFNLNDQKVYVTPSIGISLFPEDGQEAESLLAKADAAMYNVKSNGCNSFSFYSKELENQAKERLVLETELHHAIKAEQFEMYYQPQIDIKSGRLVGTEALIRWVHPQKGLISPVHFIPLAEETGLIIEIGEWIIKTVCKQIQSWQTLNYPSVNVAINLSAYQFHRSNLVHVINRNIVKHGISPELLQVEITESMIIQDINRMSETLDDLKSVGISIAIDDFGTGYSSLQYLKRFPIDKLKIDKSFVDNLLQNSDDASIVQAVIALGHKMNMKIIAEGIESEEQEQFLLQHQCDYGQGYYYSIPLTAESMGQLIVEFTAKGQV